SKLVRSMLIDTDFSGRNGTAEVEKIFDAKLFSFPKPIALLKTLLNVSIESNDIVLDFFGGSGTTGHAVSELNLDGGNRKYILVQLPEATDEKSEAFKAGYKKISDITIERNKRVINNIIEKKKKEQADLFS